MILNLNQLCKFGWHDSYYDIPLEINNQLISTQQYISYRYLNFYIINRSGEYFFVKSNKNEIEEYKITNNAELFILIIKNNAFNETYRRHFKINKLLKK
jgi:hypothetical protein